MLWIVGGGITMIVQPTQNCWTTWVMLTSFRHVVLFVIVKLFTGAPERFWTCTEMVESLEAAVHVCETSAICVAALLPQVICVVSHGATGGAAVVDVGGGLLPCVVV